MYFYLQHCIGGTDRGNEDGDFTQARFNSPQGVAINGDNVYVADAENHTIRQVCFSKAMQLEIAEFNMLSYRALNKLLIHKHHTFLLFKVWCQIVIQNLYVIFGTGH